MIRLNIALFLAFCFTASEAQQPVVKTCENNSIVRVEPFAIHIYKEWRKVSFTEFSFFFPKLFKIEGKWELRGV